MTPARMNGEFVVPETEQSYEVTVGVGGMCEPQSTSARELCRARITSDAADIGGGSPWRGNHLLAMLADGGMRVAGQFSTSLHVGDRTYRSQAQRSAFLIDLDASCRVVRMKIMGEQNNDIWPYGLAVDASGNSYVSGQIGGSYDFGSGTLQVDTYASFLVKFDAQGNGLWAKVYSNRQQFSDIRVDGEGNLYVGGYQTDTAPGALEALLPIDGIYGFAKFAPTGELLWTRAASVWNVAMTLVAGYAHFDVHRDGRVAVAACISGLNNTADAEPSCSVSVLDANGEPQQHAKLVFSDRSPVGDPVVAFGADGRIGVLALIVPPSLGVSSQEAQGALWVMDSQGRELWRQQDALGAHVDPYAISAVAFDRWNNVLAATSFAGPQEAAESNALYKRDADGKSRWSMRIDEPRDAALVGLDTNAAGEVGFAHVFGSAQGPATSLVIVKLAP